MEQKLTFHSTPQSSQRMRGRSFSLERLRVLLLPQVRQGGGSVEDGAEGVVDGTAASSCGYVMLSAGTGTSTEAKAWAAAS